MRPDVPPVSEGNSQQRQARDSETTAEASFRARPQFRSALEQVKAVLPAWITCIVLSSICLISASLLVAGSFGSKEVVSLDGKAVCSCLLL